MKKRANQVYKMKEPDVKIVALEELAKEGMYNYYTYSILTLESLALWSHI